MISEKTTNLFKETIIPIIVIAGLFFALYWITSSSADEKERDIEKKIHDICQEILDEQPASISLYDNCVNKGYELFSDENNYPDENFY